MSPREKVAILDFGSQYTKLIARRFREMHVYSEILAPDDSLDDPSIRAVVLSGGPRSVYEEGAPQPHPSLWKRDLPMLGVCYGWQLMAHHLGGEVRPARSREYGPAELEVLTPGILFEGLPPRFRVWMSHGDIVEALPPGFVHTARTPATPFAAAEDPQRRRFAVQFHPEVSHTQYGREILRHFAFRGAGLSGDWRLEDFLERKGEEIRQRVGSDGVLLALSGGVDSSTLAAFLHRLIPDQLFAVFVDTGLLKKGERERVVRIFGNLRHLHVVDARERFFQRLRGVEDPEEKRRIIGHTFVEVFREVARELPGHVRFLAQGTLYPDVIESGKARGPAATIKTHHNVGGLPEELGFELLEPFRELFKDEVREIARMLGLPEEMVTRHPFPGPGFAVRILGEVTPDRVALLQEADRIVEEETRKAGFYETLWQIFPVLIPLKSVGVMGDERTYAWVLAIRAVVSEDGMTADWARLPHALLDRMAVRLVGEVRGINRVVYDITSKPPGTIEWE